MGWAARGLGPSLCRLSSLPGPQGANQLSCRGEGDEPQRRHLESLLDPSVQLGARLLAAVADPQLADQLDLPGRRHGAGRLSAIGAVERIASKAQLAQMGHDALEGIGISDDQFAAGDAGLAGKDRTIAILVQAKPSPREVQQLKPV